MPLLNPTQIHQALNPRKTPKSGERSNSDLLDEAGLSKEEVLLNVASMMRSGETDGVRLKAADTALKLHGMMSADASDVPHVTIVIHDSTLSINPILIPREMNV